MSGSHDAIGDPHFVFGEFLYLVVKKQMDPVFIGRRCWGQATLRARISFEHCNRSENANRT
jgi:hypothetical protein